MNRNFTIQDILNSAVGPLNEHLRVPVKKGNKQPQVPRKPSKEKKWIRQQLFAWCHEKGLTFVPEVKNWHPARKWRFDWGITIPATEHRAEVKIAIEYEGIYSGISRHTTMAGYSEDADKYREAVKYGWLLLRYTSKNYEKLIQDLDKLFSEIS